MSEAHKPDQWPKAVQDAMAAGGRICKFQDVPVKGDCLVRFGTGWVQGIKLSKFSGGVNFTTIDENGNWSQRFYDISPSTTAITIPEPEPAEETIETTFDELQTGDEFLFQGYHLVKISTLLDRIGRGMKLEGEGKGLKLCFDNPSTKVKKIVRKGKAFETNVPTPDSAGPDAPFNC